MASTFPHVTITVAGKENGADASGELNTLSLGYGFHQAWIYSAMFSAGVFFGTDTPFTMLFDGAYSCSLIVLVISMIFFGIALLALGVTNQMFLALLRVEAGSRAFRSAHLFGHLRVIPRPHRRPPWHPCLALRGIDNGHRIESYGRAVGHGVCTL